MPALIWAHGAGAAAQDPPFPSLRAALGPSWTVTAPELGEPDPAAWTRTLRRALDEAAPGTVAVGHSLGASHLLKTLAGMGPQARLRGMVGLAPPFWGLPGWDVEGYALPPWAAEALTHLPVRLFFGARDEVVTPDHGPAWAAALPNARTYLLEDQGHDFAGSLAAVAMAIAEL